MSHRRTSLILAIVSLAAVLSVPNAAAIDRCVGILCVLDSPVLQAVPGDHHACFLLADGDVVCGGGNEWGQAEGRRQQDAVAIASGVAHACALLRNGDVDCWGAPEDAAADRAGGDAVAIDAAGHQTCALLRSGNVDCWGSNGFGSAPDWTHGGAVAVDVTVYYACALLADTSVDCWDIEDGTFGQSYGWSGGVVALGGGDQHSCVVLDTGNVRCWGTAGSVAPYDGGDAIAVDGGYYTTCILTTARDVRCFGSTTVEDGACVVDWISMRPLVCEGLENGRDRRSREDGRVVRMEIYPGTSGACYVLDDASAECTGIVPTQELEPRGANEAAAPPRGVALQETRPELPARRIEQDPRVVVPVRICPLQGHCVGHVLLDPGTGPLVVDLPAVVLGPPVAAHARFDGAAASVHAGDPGQSVLATGVSAGVCVGDACVGLP